MLTKLVIIAEREFPHQDLLPIISMETLFLLSKNAQAYHFSHSY